MASTFVDRYVDKTRCSKNYRRRYRSILADSRVSALQRPHFERIGYPIVGHRADGCRIWDIDGNEYVDIAMGFGVQLFGHNARFIRDALSEQLSRGLHLGPQAMRAGEVAELMGELTAVERVAFCNTGTEAVMMALRLARAATGKHKIAMFAWSYHGNLDATLGRPRRLDGTLTTVPIAPGIVPKHVEDVLILNYGDASEFEVLSRYAKDLAAVIVEPVQSLRPDLQPKQFLQMLRKWTLENDTILIFDEILTGFRVHQGGARAVFDVDTDLVTYGKIIGGGMPIGAVAGKAHIMDFIDGGCSTSADRRPRGKRTFFAGTFNKNAVTMAAAYAVLSELKEAGPALQEHLNLKTDGLAKKLNEWLESERLRLRVHHFGSMFRFSDPRNLDAFLFRLVNEGVYVWEGRSCFLSTAHASSDITRIVEAVQIVIEAMRSDGALTDDWMT